MYLMYMKKINRFVPNWIKIVLVTAYVLARCLLAGQKSKNNIVLNMAGVLPPTDSHKIVHGGKVKLLHLRKRFGDSWKKFNISYFVSSGLPLAPTFWIKIYKAFDIKVIWNQNGVAYNAIYTNDVVQNINNLMKPIHLAHHVIYQTKFCKKSADKYLGVFNGPSSIILNPVDVNEFVPKKSPLPKEPLTLIMTGNHMESKERLETSIGTIKELHNRGIKTKLIILGNLPKVGFVTEEDIDNEIKKQNLEEWIEKRGGFLQKDAPALFQSAHILLHLKYLDPCPTVVLEALASGLPVVASLSGGLPEMVDEKSGILIPISEDFEKLHYPSVREVADAIEKISSSLDEWSKNARLGAVQKFDKRVWLDHHEQLFKEILNIK